MIADTITISLEDIYPSLQLLIDARISGTLHDEGESAATNNEARFQLVEGCFYDYTLTNEAFHLQDIGDNIVQAHARLKYTGTLAPNFFVGTLRIPIGENIDTSASGYIEFEVRSAKTSYRQDYRDMLEYITEKCTDLLLQINSPTNQHLTIDFNNDAQTLYQRFSFISSVIGTNEFSEAIHRIVSSPVTKWAEIAESKNIRKIRKFSYTNIREVISGSNRTSLPPNHGLYRLGIHSIPETISSVKKIDSVDTPENRFVKYALEEFLKFCSEINTRSESNTRLYNESKSLMHHLESQLHHGVWAQVQRPNTLKLNSPVLQRKEGYREVLRVWLMFDLAAKLIWQGGNDIYQGGKKDIASLYEYWLFFKLLELFENIFRIDALDIESLIESTKDGLSLQIKQGKHVALHGIYETESRKFNVRFSYNRSFGGKKSYPFSGSWTTTLRPDYTLTIWPYTDGFTEQQAEEQELIVHIHFDAKYKVSNFSNFLKENSSKDLDEEKLENRKGIYKNADLLKMHAYKDAIRRTGGAYILYPGDTSINQKGFHEIIPGLGAFPVRPSKFDSGISELKSFILEVLQHFINRASQREKLAFRTFDIHKDPPNKDNILRDRLPEAINRNRGLIPDETFVLIGFYKSQRQYDWIRQKRLYNFRTGMEKGSLNLDKETITAKYLLLHSTGDKESGDLWRIVGKGAKVYSKQDMIENEYPNPNPKDFYIVFDIEKASEPEFQGVKWDFRKLKNYASRRSSGLPFTASITELMQHIIK